MRSPGGGDCGRPWPLRACGPAVTAPCYRPGKLCIVSRSGAERLARCYREGILSQYGPRGREAGKLHGWWSFWAPFASARMCSRCMQVQMPSQKFVAAKCERCVGHSLIGYSADVAIAEGVPRRRPALSEHRRAPAKRRSVYRVAAEAAAGLCLARVVAQPCLGVAEL